MSVGYEGREASELIDHLRALDVSVVADVRLNAMYSHLPPGADTRAAAVIGSACARPK